VAGVGKYSVSYISHPEVEFGVQDVFQPAILRREGGNIMGTDLLVGAACLIALVVLTGFCCGLWLAQKAVSNSFDVPNVARLERKLDAIMRHLSITHSDDPPAEMLDDVRRYIREGKKISAIRAYRQTHDVSLKGAKEAVEAIMREEGFER
jgi:hypothetical protein